MSHSHTCYDCGGRTEAYDDAYCKDCATRRAAEKVARREKERAEHEAAAILLERLGFKAQAALVRKHAPPAP